MPLREQAETLAASLPPLLAASERLAAAVSLGVHGRRKSGMGETFWQFRRYRSEDPSTAVDWRQSAKSQHLFVREREWEASEAVWFWRDGSANMRFKSEFSKVHEDRPRHCARAGAGVVAGARRRTHCALWRRPSSRHGTHSLAPHGARAGRDRTFGQRASARSGGRQERTIRLAQRFFVAAGRTRKRHAPHRAFRPDRSSRSYHRSRRGRFSVLRTHAVRIR